ncbi:MAG: hypothetical protein HC906_07905 [Bacteroidales bacterium]|nr:hypothetical protein [Bacteroidales bacterium]
MEKSTKGDLYRNAFNNAVKYAKDHPTCYFMSDIRKQGVVGPEDRKWFETVAIPAAIGVGLQKAAVIHDANAFKMYYINIILQHVLKKGVPMKFFGNTEQAYQWLTEN